MLKLSKLLIFGCFAVSLAVSAQRQAVQPSTIHFETGPAPRREGTHATHLFAARLDGNGKVHVDAFIRTTIRKLESADSYTTYTCHLFGTQLGDVVPALGELYEVDSINTAKNLNSMTWKRLDRAKWPEGAKSTQGSVVVLLDRGERLRQTSFPDGGDRGLAVAVIDPAKNKAEQKTARMMVHKLKTGKPTITLEATVKENDLLLIDGKGHRVLSIVPANEKTRVVGWVELDAVGIPEADLKRDKKAYLTPTPVKK